MLEQLKYVDVQPGRDNKPQFTLWDEPGPGRQPLMMRFDGNRITAEDQGGCAHKNVVETVDEQGFLAEPASDTCTDCGEVFY